MSLGTISPVGRLSPAAKRQLLLKELRQLAPLAGLLMILLIGGGGMVSFMDLFSLKVLNLSASAFLAVFLVNVPSLFAVGVGGVLVGVEKDKRTIGWLSSLPVSSLSLINAKLLAGLIGLILTWIVFAPMSYLFSHKVVMKLDWGSFAVSLVYSLFLLLAGLAISWRMKNSTLYLVALIPIAFAPFVFAGALTEVYSLMEPAGKVPGDTDYLRFIFLLITLLLGGVLFWQLNYWFGIRCLAPQIVSSASTNQSLASKADTNRSSYFETGLAQPMSALTWQAAKQARLPLLLFSGMVVTGMLFSLLGDLPLGGLSIQVLSEGANPFGFLGFALVGLGAGWLGVIVFGLDGKNDQIRFLADRGISKRKIFVSRLLLPLAIMLALVYVQVSLFFALGLPLTASRLSPPSGQLFFPLLATMTISFLTGVWAGQFFKSLVLAFLGTPVLTVSVFLLGFSLLVIGMVDPVVAILCLAAPLVSTYWLTNSWAERNTNWKFIVQHVGWMLLLLIALISIPIVTDIWRNPLANTSTLIEIEEMGARFRNYGKDYFFQLHRDSVVYQGDLDRSKPLSEKIEDVRKDPSFRGDQALMENQIAELVAGHDWRTEIDQDLDFFDLQLNKLETFNLRSNELNLHLTRCQLVRLSVQEGAFSDCYLKQYRRMLLQLVALAKVFRKSPNLQDQDSADRIEIFLIQELLHANGMGVLQKNVQLEIAEYLADKESRREARLRAVALAWFQVKNPKTEGSGMNILNMHYFPIFELSAFEIFTGRKRKRAASIVATDLWELAKANSDVEKRKVLDSISETWKIDRELFTNGIDGYPIRVENVEQLSQIQVIDWKKLIPIGTQWSAGWEDVAIDLRNRLLEEKSSEPVAESNLSAVKPFLVVNC